MTRRHRRLRKLAFVALACAVAAPAAPTVASPPLPTLGKWTTAGLPGGYVETLAIDPADPSHVIAGTRQGLFTTRDAGGHWIGTSTGLTRVDVRSVTFDRDDPAAVYTSTTDGLFKSLDGGALWVRLPFALWPSSPDVLDVEILHGSRKRVLAHTSGEVGASDDGGWTWRTLYKERGHQVMGLATSPADPDVVYLSLADLAPNTRMLKRSDDGGETWTTVLDNREVWSLSVDPRDPMTLVAVGREGLLRSRDGGASWQVSPPRVFGTVTSVSRAPSAPDTLYASGRYEQRPGGGRFVLRSDDGGASWTHVTDHAESAYSGRFVVAPDDPETLYMPTFGNGVAKSTDGGRTFSYVVDGLTAAAAQDIAIDPNNPGVAYAVTWARGVFRSEDAGTTWTDVMSGFEDPLNPLSALWVRHVTVDAGSTVYATRLHENGPDGLAVFRSDDDGRTWTEAAPLPHDEWGSGLEAHPSEAGWLLAGTDKGVYRTQDGGATWQHAGPIEGATSDLLMHPDGKTVYVATGSNLGGDEAATGLYVSHDFAGTWERLPYPPVGFVESLALREQPSLLYAGSWGSSRIAISPDGGRTWAPAVVDPTNLSQGVMALAPDPEDPTQVLAGTAAGGLWFSRDGGVTWIPTTPGVYGHEVYDIAFMSLEGDVPAGLPDLAGEVPALAGVTLEAEAGVARVLLAPHAYRWPRVIGDAAPGARLTCARGRWSRARELTYAWTRDGSVVARGRRYEVRRTDAGTRLTCRVTATGRGGTETVPSRGVTVR